MHLQRLGERGDRRQQALLQADERQPNVARLARADVRGSARNASHSFGSMRDSTSSGASCGRSRMTKRFDLPFGKFRAEVA